MAGERTARAAATAPFRRTSRTGCPFARVGGSVEVIDVVSAGGHVDVAINVDDFRRHPVDEVVALLPGKGEAEAVCDDLDGLGLEVRGAQILVGDEGVRILDTDGTEHGYAARLSRAMIHFGSGENVLHLHHDGLVHGEALLSVGCDREVADTVADLVRRRGGHAIGYFGRGTLEAMSPP